MHTPQSEEPSPASHPVWQFHPHIVRCSTYFTQNATYVVCEGYVCQLCDELVTDLDRHDHDEESTFYNHHQSAQPAQEYAADELMAWSSH